MFNVHGPQFTIHPANPDNGVLIASREVFATIYYALEAYEERLFLSLEAVTSNPPDRNFHEDIHFLHFLGEAISKTASVLYEMTQNAPQSFRNRLDTE